MSLPTIVFILNAVSITRCQKRVQEFIDHGFKVEVYGFDRGGETYAKPTNFDIEIIGYHPVSMSYYRRFWIIVKSLRELHKKYQHQKGVIFYYFFFDVAFAATIVSNRPYIYEESDIPYANMGNTFLRNYLRRKDRRIIRKSLLTVMTSEGFIKYHGLENNQENIQIIANKVNPTLLQLEYKHKVFDNDHISIGFVGGFRYQSVLNFAEVIVKEFPNINFHVFGNIMQNKEKIEELNKKYTNVILHGIFKNPQDLPAVYEQLDLVLATYDVTSINAQYAEPNKMYESIFFRVPIVVSKGTFLSEKVNRLGIGYAVDGLEQEEIRWFLRALSQEEYEKRIKNLERIPQTEAVNANPKFFKLLDKVLNDSKINL